MKNPITPGWAKRQASREPILDKHQKLTKRAVAYFGNNQAALAEAMGGTTTDRNVAKWYHRRGLVTHEFAVLMHIATDGVVRLDEFYPDMNALYDLKPSKKRIADRNRRSFSKAKSKTLKKVS